MTTKRPVHVKRPRGFHPVAVTRALPLPRRQIVSVTIFREGDLLRYSATFILRTRTEGDRLLCSHDDGEVPAEFFASAERLLAMVENP